MKLICHYTLGITFDSNDTAFGILFQGQSHIALGRIKVRVSPSHLLKSKELPGDISLTKLETNEMFKNVTQSSVAKKKKQATARGNYRQDKK